VLSHLGRAEEAERDFRRALELNPSLSDTCYFYARHLFEAGRPREAVAMFEEAVRRNPEDFSSRCLLVCTYVGLGEKERVLPAARLAAEAVERRLRQDPDDLRALSLAAGPYLELGDRERALACIARSLELGPGELHIQYNAACAYSRMGDRERALEALDRAIAGGRGSPGWFEHDRDLDLLRGDPRFQEMARRLRRRPPGVSVPSPPAQPDPW
jgi:adenylate cyclase